MGGFDWIGVEIVPAGAQQTVFVRADDTVDVAVIPFGIKDAAPYDVLVLSEEMLASPQDIATNGIGVGTDVFFTGMFVPYLGQKKSYPIFRFGRIAMLPEEKISFLGAEIEAYLIETFAFGGNSGSPVFFYLGADRTPGSLALGPPIIKIAGLMKGSFNDVEPIKVTQAASTGNRVVPVSVGNAGIAVVVPAQKIRDILHYQALESRWH